MVTKPTMPHKKINNLRCLYCGKLLVGRQELFCSTIHNVKYWKEHNQDHVRQYSREYMRKYRVKDRNKRYCVYCGIELTGKRRRFCSDSHKEAYYKESDILHDKILKGACILKSIPLYCDECGARIVIKDGESVCISCGLVF